MAKDYQAEYNKLMKKLHEGEKPPPGVEKKCENCKWAEFHQWMNGSIKDPLICKCTKSGEYDLARARKIKCQMYSYREKWEIMKENPKIHQRYSYK